LFQQEVSSLKFHRKLAEMQRNQRLIIGGLVTVPAVIIGGYYIYKAIVGDGNEKPQSALEEKKELHTAVDNPQLKEAIALFEGTFVGQKVTHAASAPGRVNLIGEHTDYNDGFVMPCALEYRTVVVGALNQSDTIRIISKGQNDVFQIRVNELGEVPVNRRWFCYPQGVLALYQRKGVKLSGMDIAIVGNVPQGGGLSSSAALEVATATFVENIMGLNSSKVEIALLAQGAEHEFAKVPCGIMDQFISALGKEGNALMLDCRSKKPDYIPLSNPDYVVLVTSKFLITQTAFSQSNRHQHKA
jgi:galactokinase